MKRFISAALLLGMLGHAPAFLFGTPVPMVQIQFNSEIPADHLAIVLQKAASYWNISEIEAQEAYDRGDMTVTKVKDKVYRAEMRESSWMEFLVSENL